MKSKQTENFLETLGNKELLKEAIELLKECSYNFNKALWQVNNPIERGYEIGDRIEKFLNKIEK